MSLMAVTLGLLEGFKQNMTIFGLTLLMALPLGLIITFGSMSKFSPLRWLVKTFVWIIRGTPLMLQLIIIYYGPGLMLNAVEHMMSAQMVDAVMDFIRNPNYKMYATIIAFVINYAAYFSEIYRGGIQSISDGQFEAGKVLGMTKSQIFFKVVLLQVIKRIVPPMSNEIITLIKDTSLANTIAVYEIIFEAKSFMNIGLIWPFFYAGAFYLIFVGILTILFGKLEKKLSYFKV